MGLEKLAELKKQLRAETKANDSALSKPHKPKNIAPIDPVVLVIGKLQKLFPSTFPKNPAPKVPLKVGILEDLQARSEEIRISHDDLKLAIKTWCKSTRYWQACIEGAPRIDLDGNTSGVVEAKGAAQARSMSRKAKTGTAEVPKTTNKTE